MKTPEVMDMAIARQLIEVMLDRCKSGDAFESNVTVQDRRAVQKSLESSRMLMGVAHQLMVQPESLTARDGAERLKALLEEIKMAARTAYQAGLLLTGRD
ncbi:hypothetical protein QTH97_31860 [Variovorax sp. J22R24]|uniref:hypothetical protein n=1 Tax=Variovorax gracilis TaxID=3053502 RepID=UPI00257580A7|nr:hypothetical protein [Variovorax sp. J22R24]MDM0109559.1 hypothetical protein [Variovorax sp. J22R24]